MRHRGKNKLTNNKTNDILLIMRIINRKTIFLFDYWYMIGYFFLFLFSGIIVSVLDTFKNNLLIRILGYFVSVYYFSFFAFNIIKGISGIILLIKAFVEKQIAMIKKSYLFHIIFIISLILIVCVFRFRLNDPDINYTIEIMGLSISTFIIYLCALINLFINIIGIPMWPSFYIFSDDQIKKEKKLLLHILTTLIIFFTNLLIFIGLTVD